MSPVEALELLGGVATRAQLIAASTRREVDAALAAGDVVAVARGRYALPTADDAIRAAHRVTGVVSHRSAALRWGWAVKTPPSEPDVCVPRNRHLPVEAQRGTTIHRIDLQPDEVTDGVTARDRTLLDCLRDSPFDEALAVADSALRDGFPPHRLARLAREARGPGSRQIRRVAAEARAEADNPFESALRAIALDVPGLTVRPQVPIFGPTEFLGRPDLVDEDLGIVLEADSFAWHGDRAALRDDARRYDLLVVHGWLVLRFAWEDVMFDAEWVRSILVAAVAERTDRRCRACRAA
jgi:very-short-patch-repair endonuclease